MVLPGHGFNAETGFLTGFYFGGLMELTKPEAHILLQLSDVKQIRIELNALQQKLTLAMNTLESIAFWRGPIDGVRLIAHQTLITIEEKHEILKHS